MQFLVKQLPVVQMAKIQRELCVTERERPIIKTLSYLR